MKLREERCASGCSGSRTRRLRRMKPTLVSSAREPRSIFKAALGAIVVFSRGPQHRKDLVELEAVVRALMTRGLATLYQALAEAWDELARISPMRDEARLLADAFRTASMSTSRGKAPTREVLDKIAQVKRSFSELAQGVDGMHDCLRWWPSRARAAPLSPWVATEVHTRTTRA